MINYEELIQYISDKKHTDFLRLFKNIDNNAFFMLLKVIINSESASDSFFKLSTLAEFIFLERQGRHFGEPEQFRLTEDMKFFQELVYSIKVFSAVSAPFKEWKGLVDILLQLIREMDIKRDTDSKKYSALSDFNFEIKRTLDKILEDSEMKIRYLDYINGAL